MSWQDQALCATVTHPTGPNLWDPGTGAENDEAYAAMICRPCPVKEQCLDFALAHETSDESTRAAIYGGHTPRQRAALARQRKRTKDTP